MNKFVSLQGGAFHNTYLSVLTEKGLVVFVPALMMAAFLVCHSCRLYACRALFTGLDASHAAVMHLIVVIMLVRGLSEHAGWWGYANGTVDYTSYAAASLIVALTARLDRVAYPKRVRKGGKYTRRWT